MDDRRIAAELLVVARELIGAVKDLADVRKVLSDLREKQEEIGRIEEEHRRKLNKMHHEARRDLDARTIELLNALEDAIVGYFKSTGRGVRKVDNGGQLLEVFIGSDDDIERVQSKVSVHIALGSQGRQYESFMLRNEDTRQDKKAVLWQKSTVPKLLQEIKKADKRGYWDIGR